MSEKHSEAKEFEKIVANIYKTLDGTAIIKHDDSIFGLESETNRQIDISIRSRIAGHDILIIVDCKNWNKRIDVPHLGSFIALMRDVGAHKGVLISKKGFSKATKPYAKRNGVDLCQAHDAETRNWKLELKIPILLEEIASQFNISFRLKLDTPTNITTDINKWEIAGVYPTELFIKDWNSGRLNYDIGNHIYAFNPDQPTLKLPDSLIIPLENLHVTYTNTRKFFITYLDEIPSSKAIQNLTSGETHITLKLEDIASHRPNFIPINSPDSTNIKPLYNIRILGIPKIDSVGGGTIELIKTD